MRALTPTARKFADFLGQEAQELQENFKIQYGTFSSRIDPQTGTKARNATCYHQDGKVAAIYDAANNEIYL